jgi:hypothetical protein
MRANNRADQLALPYREYSDADLAHRYVYVEVRAAARSCEFCLSALAAPHGISRRRRCR